MEQSSGTNNRLYWLGRITACAIAGILLLQGYWLVTSFREQQSHFSADVESALMVAILQRQLSEAFAGRLPEEYGDLIGSTLSDALVNAKIDAPVGFSSVQVAKADIRLDSTDTAGSQGAMLRQLIRKYPGLLQKQVKPAKQQSRAELLASYRKQLRKELLRRSIETDVELALLDEHKKLIVATCDSAAFYRTGQKSSAARINTGSLGVGNYLQAGFPRVNAYLFRRMALILAVTGLLAVICCVSFAMLLKLFFSQKRNADMRNDFMNNMTHELKTPITGVSIALQLIRDKRQPMSEAGRQEYLAIAEGELNRLSALLDKILRMAAFERKEIVLTPSGFEAGALIKEVVDSIRPLIAASGASLSTSVPPGGLPLYADRTHLALVLRNLIENAVKYNDKPTPEISVSVSRKDAVVTIEVADNGKGIPAHYLGRVFDKFFRVPGGDLHDIKGHGLGLSYVKAIVDLHAGRIDVASTPGTGTVFRIEIPQRQQAATAL